jgi:hypothetical protein
VKEAHFVSILAHPRLDSCSQTVSSQDKQLVITFCVKGQNATGFSKDLSDEFANWQIENPEQLHQKILDLLSFTRQKKLELEFSLSLLGSSKIIFASYSGGIILKRNGQVRKILQSNKEIKIIVGNFKDNDQIILLNESASEIEARVMELLSANISLQKLVSEVSLLQIDNQNLGESLAFLTYKPKIEEEEKELEKKQKLNFTKIIAGSQIVFNKILEILKKINEIAKNIFFQLKKQNKKKLMIISGTFFLIAAIFFASMVFANRQNERVTSNIQKQIEEITKNTNNIEVLTLTQPLLARETAQKSLSALEDLKKTKNSKESLKLINSEIDKLKQLIIEISGNNSLDQLSVAYNLEDFLGKKIEIKNQEIFILENSGQEILRIKVDQSREKIALANKQTIRNFTVSENKLFVLSAGIQMLDLEKNDQSFSQIKEEGESDKSAELLSSFGPYLYLLNKDKRNVYRYYYNRDKLSEPIGWLVDKEGVNFNNINDLLVDGDLWLSSKEGELFKFSKGSRSDFAIKGLEQLPTSAIILSTSENGSSIALLEKQNKRLLILTKDGQLISEVKSNELAGVSSIAFANDEKKIFALSGSIVYEVLW